MSEEVIKEENSTEESEIQVYEIGFHILPSVEEEKVAAEVDSIKALIEKQGGAFIADEFPKKIALAYTIAKDMGGKRQKFDTAYFGWIKFEMKTESIMNVKNNADKNKNILRFLIIKTVKESTLAAKNAIFTKEEAPSAQVGPKHTKKVLKDDEKGKKEGPKMSEEELDKTIEELIVE